jgi:hypothetical protein
MTLAPRRTRWTTIPEKKDLITLTVNRGIHELAVGDQLDHIKRQDMLEPTLFYQAL